MRSLVSLRERRFTNTMYRLLVLSVLFVLALFLYVGPHGTGENLSLPLESGACDLGKLCVSFLDVGQGDAIFIESPTGVQVLVDGGRGSGVLRELGSRMSYFDHSLDMIVATHEDADHIGGLIDVLERYDVVRVLRTDNENDTPVADVFRDRVIEEGADIAYAMRGQVYEIGGGVTLEVLFPDRSMVEVESNTSSIVLRLVYGETEVLLTGDSPKNIEEYLVLISGADLESDILKLGHHGSRTSTSELFLKQVGPQYGIVSAAKDNTYGHPHVEVTDLLFNEGIDMLSTAEEGTITFVSDGVDIVRE